METIGQRIKYIRESILRLNQEGLAVLLGAKGKSTISNWENDNATPEVKYLLLISKASGKSIDWILKGDEGPPVIREASPQYKIKTLEEENQELKGEIERLRSKISHINSVTQAEIKIKKKRKK